jgi:hypothetical protein
LDLYNQRIPIREIARQAGMSFRDIGRIIDREEKEKEAREGQVQQITQSTQAYKRFSDDSSDANNGKEVDSGLSGHIITYNTCDSSVYSYGPVEAINYYNKIC